MDEFNFNNLLNKLEILEKEDKYNRKLEIKNWLGDLNQLFSFVTIITTKRKNSDKIPQNTDPKKIVERIKKKMSRLVILLKNNGLVKN